MIKFLNKSGNIGNALRRKGLIGTACGWRTIGKDVRIIYEITPLKIGNEEETTFVFGRPKIENVEMNMPSNGSLLILRTKLNGAKRIINGVLKTAMFFKPNSGNITFGTVTESACMQRLILSARIRLLGKNLLLKPQLIFGAILKFVVSAEKIGSEIIQKNIVPIIVREA